jgi:hypothetical protein
MIHFEDVFCIEAVESEVIELYRSTLAVSFPVENSPPLSAQAFVGLLTQEDGQKIFIAFHCREIRRSLIFVSGHAVARPGMGDALLKARGVTESMGFRMEPVNLKYSPAMREVILRDIPVLLSPRNARRLLQERAAEQAELTLITEQATANGATGDGESRDGKTPAAAAQIVKEKLAAEKRLDDQAAALRLKIERLLLQEYLPPSTMEADCQSAAAAGDNAVAARQELAAERDRLQRVVAEGEAERKRLESAAAASRKELENLRRLLKKAQAEIDAAAARQAGDATAALEHRNRIAELEAGLRQAEAEMLEQRTAFERRLEEQAAAASRTGSAALQLAEMEIKLRDAEAKCGEERAGRDRLATAKAADERLIEELRAALKESNARADGLKEGAKAAGGADERIRTLQDRLRAAEQQAEAVSCEKMRLEEACAACQKVIADLRSAIPRPNAAGPAKEPGDQRIEGLERALRQSEERAEFLRLEVERLAAAAAAAMNHAAEEPAPRVESRPTTLPPLSLSGTESAPSPRSLRRPPPPGAAFRVDWDLTAVPCSSVSELCEVYQGIGLVQLCLEGYPNQYCSAAVLVLKKGESRQVYMPFRLSTSKEVLIYVPARQPDTQADYTRTMKEAVRFLQTVGMEVERIPLGRKGSHPNPALESLLPLLAASPMAGNF